MGKRLRGQNVELAIVVNGQNNSNLTKIKSFSFEPMMETQEEGFLGHTSNEFDDIFNGISGDIELQIPNRGYIDFLLKVIKRARDQEPGTKINIKCTCNFSVQGPVRLMFADISIESPKFDSGGRGEYVTGGFSFKCTDISVI